GVSKGMVDIREGLFVPVDASGASFIRAISRALAGVAGVGALTAVLAFEGAVVVRGPVMVAGQGGYPFGHEKTRSMWSGSGDTGIVRRGCPGEAVLQFLLREC